MRVGQIVYWARTTGHVQKGRADDFTTETDHRVGEGRVVSFDDDTVCVAPGDRKHVVFLPAAAVFAGREFAWSDCERLNAAMFGHKGGKWAAEHAGIHAPAYELQPKPQDAHYER